MALLEGIAALVAKVASASTVAQATAGLGIAVAGVTGAGAAGVLPGPVQDTVAGAVEAVTPFELPHSADDASGRPRTSPEVRDDDPTPVVPTTSVVVPPPATPTTEAAEQEAETEHGTEIPDSTHQHRGGRTAATGPSSDDSPETTEAPEVEDDHAAVDDSRHGGSDSGSDSGSGSGHDDGSGHGGDD